MNDSGNKSLTPQKDSQHSVTPQTVSIEKIKDIIMGENDSKHRFKTLQSCAKRSDMVIESVPRSERSMDESPPQSSCREEAVLTEGELVNSNVKANEFVELLDLVQELRAQCNRLEKIAKSEALRLGYRINMAAIIAKNERDQADSEISELGSIERYGSWWVFPKGSRGSLKSEDDSTIYDEVGPSHIV